MTNQILKKIKLYGVKKSIKYGVSEIRYLFRQLFKSSFSQLGEDLIIDRYLVRKKKGFYIDIGAGDGNRFSNAKRFYKKGWRGINIEPNPGSYKKLLKKRNKDVNLNIGVGEIETELTFYVFFQTHYQLFLRRKQRSIKNKDINFYII